jgi:hypothetical protein
MARIRYWFHRSDDKIKTEISLYGGIGTYFRITLGSGVTRVIKNNIGCSLSNRDRFSFRGVVLSLIV